MSQLRRSLTVMSVVVVSLVVLWKALVTHFLLWTREHLLKPT